MLDVGYGSLVVVRMTQGLILALGMTVIVWLPLGQKVLYIKKRMFSNFISSSSYLRFMSELNEEVVKRKFVIHHELLSFDAKRNDQL